MFWPSFLKDLWLFADLKIKLVKLEREVEALKVTREQIEKGEKQ